MSWSHSFKQKKPCESWDFIYIKQIKTVPLDPDFREVSAPLFFPAYSVIQTELAILDLGCETLISYIKYIDINMYVNIYFYT